MASPLVTWRYEGVPKPAVLPAAATATAGEQSQSAIIREVIAIIEPEGVPMTMPAADIEVTHAYINVTSHSLGFSPRIGLYAGIARIVDWFRRYHNF